MPKLAEDREDFLKIFHRVSVVSDTHGRGYWWANAVTASGFPLPSPEEAWAHAWKKLVEEA